MAIWCALDYNCYYQIAIRILLSLKVAATHNHNTYSRSIISAGLQFVIFVIPPCWQPRSNLILCTELMMKHVRNDENDQRWLIPSEFWPIFDKRIDVCLPIETHRILTHQLFSLKINRDRRIPELQYMCVDDAMPSREKFMSLLSSDATTCCQLTDHSNNKYLINTLFIFIQR